MRILESLLGWFREKAERGSQRRAAAKCADARVAGDALGYLVRRPEVGEVVVDSPHGKALFTRKDVPRLQAITKSVGEKVFARAMMGGSAYGFPGGWSQDRVEQVQHLKSWVYIAVRSIWQRIARLTPNVGFVTAQQQANATQLKRGEFYTRKSMSAIRPYESVTPAGDAHPLVRLFNNPNRPDVAYDLWYELGLFLELTGNSYLWAVPSNLGLLDRTYKAAELWVIPSHWVWPRIGKDRLIEYYEVRPWVGPGVLRFPPEDVIHLRYKSPIHKIDGYSPQTAGAEWIDTGESVNRARFWQFKNGCYVTGNLKLGDQYHDPDDEELERMYSKFFARFQGEHRSGMPIITPPGAEYVPLTINPVEMAYTQSADQLRDWILALWGVPKEVAGIQDAGSEIAMYGPLRQFSENALMPRLTYIGQALTEKLARRWDRRLRVWWDDPTPDDPQQKIAEMKMRHETQSITRNEIRAAYGDPPLPGGDEVSHPEPQQPQFGVPPVPAAATPVKRAKSARTKAAAGRVRVKSLLTRLRSGVNGSHGRDGHA